MDILKTVGLRAGTGKDLGKGIGKGASEAGKSMGAGASALAKGAKKPGSLLPTGSTLSSTLGQGHQGWRGGLQASEGRQAQQNR
jgi:hypothetical protein